MEKDSIQRRGASFKNQWIEQLNNPDFNPIEFDGIRKQAGLNSFILTSRQWIEKTNARGIIAKPQPGFAVKN